MEKIKLTKRDIIHAVCGLLYEMAPFNKPRRADEIINHCIEYCDEKIGKEYKLRLTDKEVRDFVYDMLFDFEPFRQLNLSQAEIDKGITDCDDPNRRGLFSATFVGHDSNGDVVSIESTRAYHDFIDLDAYLGNLACELISMSINSRDCMFCKYAKEYYSCEPSGCEKCQTCYNNPNYTSNYESHPMSLIPRNSEEYKKWAEETGQGMDWFE